MQSYIFCFNLRVFRGRCPGMLGTVATVGGRLFSLSWTAKKEKKGMAKKEKEAESALGSARLPAPRLKGPGPE
ncbi:MAG: hypothetical protein K2O66_04495, partial [Bacteroidales bacterium]|nr:hypothetical protein [Bacteroidales bacterium]